MSAARPPTRPAVGAPTVHVPGGRLARPSAALSPVHTSNNVEISSFRQSRNKLNIVEISVDIVTVTGNTVAKNGNNVEATFDFVEWTKFYDKLVRHCCRLWQQSRMLLRQSRTFLPQCCLLLRHRCWCGRGLTDDASQQNNTGPLGGPVITARTTATDS